MPAFRGNSSERTESLLRYGRERWASLRRILIRASLVLRIGILLLGAIVVGPGRAQSANALPVPTQADAFYDGYRLRDGQIVKRLRMHYATLGSPHRAANGDIDNAVMVLHWTGSSGASLLTAECRISSVRDQKATPHRQPLASIARRPGFRACDSVASVLPRCQPRVCDTG